VPLGTACFWIENLSRNRLPLNGMSAINLTRFFKKKKFSFTFFFSPYYHLQHMLKNLNIGSFWVGGGGKTLARFLAPDQEANASIVAEELFQLPEFCTCLTDFLCFTTAPFSIFRNSRVDWHILHLKLCLLAGTANSHDWEMGFISHAISKFVIYFITWSEKLK